MEGANQIIREQWEELIAKHEELSVQLREDLMGLVKGIEGTVNGKRTPSTEEA